MVFQECKFLVFVFKHIELSFEILSGSLTGSACMENDNIQIYSSTIERQKLKLIGTLCGNLGTCNIRPYASILSSYALVTLAARYGGKTTVQFLIEQMGMNPSETDSLGKNCFIYAALGEQIETLGYLNLIINKIYLLVFRKIFFTKKIS